MDDPISKAERRMIARARHAFTRLGGLEFGDKLADKLYDARVGIAKSAAKNK